jgi:uncharacterized protein YndB with AHSA1/START domain
MMVTNTPRATASMEPVVKELVVPLTLEQAFELFTTRIAEWWPLRSHSVEGDDAVGCHFEPLVGGRLLETGRSGRQHVWGTVTAWQPPNRLALTWHPGHTADTAQDLEITFSKDAEGTRLRLVHTGWERLGDAGRAERDNYDPGWDYVLGRLMALISS